MRLRVWILLLLIVGVGCTIGASARYLVRQYGGGEQQTPSASPVAVRSAPVAPVAAPVPPPSNIAPAPAEKRERWATGYVVRGHEVVVLDSDGNTWTNRDEIQILRGSVIVAGERLMLRPARLAVAPETAQNGAIPAGLVSSAPTAASGPEKSAGTVDVQECGPEWEIRGRVQYLRDRGGIAAGVK